MARMVRGSELTDFLRCRLKWRYYWVDGYVPKTPDKKLFFGTLFHKFVEVWYATGRDFQSALQAMEELFRTTDTSGMEQTEIDELWDLAVNVAVNYDRTYRDVDTFKVLAQELTFAVPVTDDIVYTGTVDLVYAVDGGWFEFMDHKTTSSLDRYVKKAKMDRQISRYWGALLQLQSGEGMIQVGEEFVPVTETEFYQEIRHRQLRQFVYNIILKAYPVPPRLLKSGKLSQDKGQNTTYELFMQEIEKLGQNPDDYAEFLAYLKENPRRYFQRVEVIRNINEINSAMYEGVKVMLDMENPRIYRNITDNCEWDCPYKDVCLAGMDGSDTSFLLQTLFTREEGQI